MQGGGRYSTWETIGRVAAGAVAKKILELKAGIEVRSYYFQYCNLHKCVEAYFISFSSLYELDIFNFWENYFSTTLNIYC